MESLNKRLRELFNRRFLYTVDQLSYLTNESHQYVRVMISRIKNPKYCNKNEKPLDLILEIGKDGKRRWGMRGVFKHAIVATGKRRLKI